MRTGTLTMSAGIKKSKMSQVTPLAFPQRGSCAFRAMPTMMSTVVFKYQKPREPHSNLPEPRFQNVQGNNRRKRDRCAEYVPNNGFKRGSVRNRISVVLRGKEDQGHVAGNVEPEKTQKGVTTRNSS
jgi:hypothetical protein